MKAVQAMAPVQTSRAIAAQIDDQIKLLNDEVARLTKARDLLLGEKKQAQAKKTAAARKRGSRNTPRIPVAQRAEQILDVLQGSDGLTTKEIGPRVGVTDGYARQIIHETLIKAGKVELVPDSEPRRYRLSQTAAAREPEPALV
jgi:hypothetical protein